MLRLVCLVLALCGVLGFALVYPKDYRQYCVDGVLYVGLVVAHDHDGKVRKC